MACDERWVYTPWGYGKLAEQSSTKSVVNMTWGGTGYLSASSVSDSVKFSVKLFSMGRKVLLYEWGVTQDFSSFFSLISKELSLSSNIQLSLYYPSGKLRKLQPSDTPLKLRLKSNSQLVCITKQNFTWDPSKKSPNIELLGDLLTVKKKDDCEVMFESVLGTISMQSGTHHWEIKVDFLMDYEEEEEIFIGVCMKNTNLAKNPLECEYWGIMCLSAKKFSQNFSEDYGDNFGTNDIVGVNLEYKENKGTLSFSKNGISLGSAFCDIPSGVHPAITLNYPKIQVTLCKSNGN